MFSLFLQNKEKTNSILKSVLTSTNSALKSQKENKVQLVFRHSISVCYDWPLSGLWDVTSGIIDE